MTHTHISNTFILSQPNYRAWRTASSSWKVSWTAKVNAIYNHPKNQIHLFYHSRIVSCLKNSMQQLKQWAERPKLLNVSYKNSALSLMSFTTTQKIKYIYFITAEPVVPCPKNSMQQLRQWAEPGPKLLNCQLQKFTSQLNAIYNHTQKQIHLFYHSRTSRTMPAEQHATAETVSWTGTKIA